MTVLEMPKPGTKYELGSVIVYGSRRLQEGTTMKTDLLVIAGGWINRGWARRGLIHMIPRRLVPGPLTHGYLHRSSLGARVRHIRCDQVLVGRGRTDAFRLIVRPAKPNRRHWAPRKTELRDTLWKSITHTISQTVWEICYLPMSKTELNMPHTSALMSSMANTAATSTDLGCT